MILMSLMSEMYPGLRREHDSEVGWRESYAKTNGFESLMYEMWPGLRREHDSDESDRCDGENPMQKPMVSRA